jgi:hypothetical protein
MPNISGTFEVDIKASSSLKVGSYLLGVEATLQHGGTKAVVVTVNVL